MRHNICGQPMRSRSLMRGEQMAEVLQLLVNRIDTPIGEMVLVADHDGNLRAIDWTDHEPRMHRFLRLHCGKGGFSLEAVPEIKGLTSALHRYFAGELTVIDSLPVR